MPRRRTLLGALLGAPVLVACTSSGDGGTGFVSGDPGLTVVPVEERRPAPIVTGEGLEGEELTSEHPGKVVVINVWGSWCAPCRKEAPDLEQAHQDTKDEAVFLGINTRDASPAPALAFQRSFGVTYPSVFDPQGRTLLQFADHLPPSGIPSTLVIDAQGRVAARVIGVIDQRTLTSLIGDVAKGG